MADALQFAATKAATHSDILARLALQPQGYLLATVHRAENTDDNQRLTNILSAFAAFNEPVVFPAHPRTRKLLQETGYQPPENVKLIDPVGYFDVIALERPLHNYIKPASMSYRRRPVSSIIKPFLDSGFHRNDE